MSRSPLIDAARIPYVYGLFRETFGGDGQARHRTRGQVSRLTLRQREALHDFIPRGCPQDSGPRCEVKTTLSRFKSPLNRPVLKGSPCSAGG